MAITISGSGTMGVMASGGITGGATITSGTAVASTSGTSIDFTGIPSWVKRVTVMFNGVSTSSTSSVIIQIGSGSVTTTGYFSMATGISGTGLGTSSYTTGFGITNTSTAVATNTISGNAILSTLGSNIWVESHSVGANTSGPLVGLGGGNLTLSGALDQVRITTVNGTDTFDAGSINILYE